MSRREQKNFFDKLKRYERKFDSKELYDYKMLLKRHKDDEELDKQSLSRLKILLEKYHLNRPKKDYDHFFTKVENNESDE
jgi:predicted nucleotidyltransferase component of viral defense system